MATCSTRKRVWTDDDLESLPRNGHKYELLEGELIMSPVHAQHGTICMRLGALLFNFVQPHKLGEVYDSSTGFRLSQKLLLSEVTPPGRPCFNMTMQAGMVRQGLNP
jgi:Uma2 family endonuclease